MKNWLHKSMMLGIILLIANLFFLGTAMGQSGTFYYRGTGALNVASNWSSNANGIGGASPTIFTSANQFFNVRNIAAVSNSGTWTVSGTNSKIIVGDGTAATNLTIPTGVNTIIGTVDVSAAATLTITNTTIPILGTLNATSTVVYNGTAAQTIAQVAYGNLAYSGSSTGSFGGSGTYTIAGNFSFTSGNFTFNTANQNKVFNITGNFSISSTGTIDFGSGNGHSVINLSGNFSRTNGIATTTGNTENGLFNMVGAGQTILANSTGTIMKWVDFAIPSGITCSLAGDFNFQGTSGTPAVFTVSNGGTLNTGAFNIIGVGTPAGNNEFVLSAGGTLGIGSAAGITTAGTASGNIQSLVRTLSIGGNYVYNGTGAQSTGTGFPTNLTGSLAINNTGNTVTLSAARTIANGGIVNLTAGIFAAGTNLTMATTSNINRSAGSLTGNLQGVGKYNVTYTGLSKTTGPELLNAGLNNLTINETSSSNTVTSGNAFTASANVTVTQGNLIIQGTDASYTTAGNLVVSTNGTFTHSVNWDVFGKQFNVGGNIDVTGVITYTVRSHISMTGTSKTIRTGTPPASAVSILTLTGATVSANGTVTINDNFWAPFNTAGSFSTNGQSVTANSSVLISGGTVNVNGGSLTVSNGVLLGSGTTSGILNVSSGTFVTDGITLGDPASTSASSITQSGGSFTVNGGVTINQPNAIVTNNWNINNQTATVSGLISFAGASATAGRNAGITITTGTLNANGGMSFTASAAATKVIIMSAGAGTINLKGSLTVPAASSTLTAGTAGSIFNYNDNTTAQTVNFFSAGAYHNLHINTTGGTGASLSAAITATNVTGNLRVLSGTLDNGGFAIAGNAAKIFRVNNGAFFNLTGTTSAFPTLFGTVSLAATSTVNYAGSGDQTISAENYGHLTTALNGTRTITLANAGTIGIAGVFTPAGGTTSYANSGSTVSFNGATGSQNVPAFAFNNLTINNTSGVVLDGNISVNGGVGALTFTNGKITTGVNAVTLASTANSTTAGAGKYIFGYQTYIVPTGTPTGTFYIGDATNYTPATIAFTSNITSGGTLTVSTTAGDHPSIGTSGLDASKSVNRYWTLTNAGISPVSYNATFNFIGPVGSGDIDAGVNTSNLSVKGYNGSNWFSSTNGTRTATSTEGIAFAEFGDFQVAEPPCVPPTINTPAVTNVSCNGSSNGAIDISTTGGTTPFTYLWSNGATTEDISGVSAGVYSLVITATSGCNVSSGPISVSQPAVLDASFGSTNVNCNGGTTGSITITSPSGGGGTYEYSINGGTNWFSGGSFTSLGASTYNVQIRDAVATSCVVTLNGALVISQLSLLNATVGSSDAGCAGGDGSITLTSPTGGAGTYEYSIDGGSTWLSSGSFTGLPAATYNVQIRDAVNISCVIVLNAALVIGQQTTIPAPVSGGNQTVCYNGDNEQTITATATSPATITWYDAATGGSIVSPPSLTGIGTSTYYAEASSGSCVSATRTAVTLTIQNAPSSPVSGGDQTVCYNGNPSQTLTATATSAATITWYDAATAGNIVTPTLVGIGTVTYFAEASNGTCPSPNRTPVTLTINPVLATPGAISGPTDVCPLVGSLTPSVYSIAAVSGATFYTWLVPAGTTIVSGQGTTTLNVTFDNNFAQTNQFFKVTAESPSACTSAASSLEVLKNIPGIAIAISGPTDACTFIGQPRTAVYSIDPVLYATSYTWVLTGANMALVSGQGTTSIEVSYTTGFTSGNIKVTANSNCGNRAPRSLNITKFTPAAPVVINGPADACAFIGTPTQVNYTIDPVLNAISYTWTVPANVTLESGQGSTSVMVTFNSGYTTGVIKVKSVSNCGSSGDRSLSVVALAASTPGNISGPTNACIFIGTPNNATYFISPVANATSYNWAVPAGASIVSHPAGTGINDTIITVSFNNSFVGGTSISVQAIACISSSARTLSISRLQAATPGIITGATNACSFMISGSNPSGTPVPYTIRKVANANGYTWTAPSGASITAHPAGTGVNDTSILIIYTAGFVSGSVTVAAVNDCGTGGIRSLAITKLTPGTPGAITIVNTVICPNRQYTYTLASMPTNSTSILWTVPAGATILSGQGGLSITVSYTSGIITGTVTATAYNNCANSSTRSTNINLPACGGRPAIVGKGVTAPVAIAAAEPMKLNVFPNPTVSDFKLQVISAGKETIAVKILDMQGRELKHIKVMPFQTIHIGAELKAGSYLVEVNQGKNKTTQKLLKF